MKASRYLAAFVLLLAAGGCGEWLTRTSRQWIARYEPWDDENQPDVAADRCTGEALAEVLRRRLAPHPKDWLSTVRVDLMPERRVRVWVRKHPSALRDVEYLLTTGGRLELSLVAEGAASEPLADNLKIVREAGLSEPWRVERSPVLTERALEEARVGFDDQQRPVVDVLFTSAGGDAMHALTSANVGRQLAIVIDETLLSAPTIRGPIRRRGTISGRWTLDEASRLAQLLDNGALPCRVARSRLRGTLMVR